jgi:hypothetical protein
LTLVTDVKKFPLMTFVAEPLPLFVNVPAILILAFERVMIPVLFDFKVKFPEPETAPLNVKFPEPESPIVAALPIVIGVTSADVGVAPEFTRAPAVPVAPVPFIVIACV